jgi:hypothetical protein
MIYLDSNVFIYATLNTEDIGNEARSLLGKVQKGHIEACSSSLTFDELVWVVKRNRNIEDAISAGEAFLNMPKLRLVDVDGNLLSIALFLMQKYRLNPRDAIHAASAITERADIMVSEDRDFEQVKEFKRQRLGMWSLSVKHKKL